MKILITWTSDQPSAFVLFGCSIFHYVNLLRKKLLLIIFVEDKLRR